MSTPPLEITNSIETQIDTFLGQFKRTASKAKDKRPVSDECCVDSISQISTFTTAVNRSQSAKFSNNTNIDQLSIDDVDSIRSETESTINGRLTGSKDKEIAGSEEIAVRDVLNLLENQYAIITGGKSKELCPIITFPDNSNFHLISDAEYERLMMYLTSVPSLQEADLGFHLIIDRRKDRWNSVKSILFKINGYFPGIIHKAYIIRPTSLLQKAISEVSNKLFKDDFKFKVIILNKVEELQDYIDKSQLTQELNGYLKYSHHDWIQQRIELQTFSKQTKQISQSLDIFLSNILETEFPNTTESTQQLLNQQSIIYNQLKFEIEQANKYGDNLLINIRENPASKLILPSTSSDLVQNNDIDKLGNVFTIERLLVQLDETEQTFHLFWQQHYNKLQQCLQLRKFEETFKELQSQFDSHLKVISEMTEIGETKLRVEQLIQETLLFQNQTEIDIQHLNQTSEMGKSLLSLNNNLLGSKMDSVQPKCNELERIKTILIQRINKRLEILIKSRDLMETIEKANCWCTKGIELLASQHIEKVSTSTELAEKSLHEIQEFIASAAEFQLKINSPKEFRFVFQDSITLETKALVMQVLQRIDDVSIMCDKRIANLKKLTVRSPRPVQTVTPERAMPLQPAQGAPPPPLLQKFIQLKQIDNQHQTDFQNSSARFTHTLTELITTEQIYVDELYSIILGYKQELLNEDMKPLLPPQLTDKIDILFGNLEELYLFHSNTFLPELQKCITSIKMVANCFIQWKDTLFKLYSFYCQNITRSEQLRESLGNDLELILQRCQRKLGHKLPLAAYLLKPVQRITKYQLLLKDLHKSYDSNDPNDDLEIIKLALDSMLIVLKCVNDSMLQIAITGLNHLNLDLSKQGQLLLQGTFQVSSETKKDLRLRLKSMQRHLFLYERVLIFCKIINKQSTTSQSTTSSQSTIYQFKHLLNMSHIGLTESVKGDNRKFEVWLQGRQEVHTIQASNLEQKQVWVNKIKNVLFNQLEELKGEKIKQYSNLIQQQKPLLRQTVSWERQQDPTPTTSGLFKERTTSCDTPFISKVIPEDTVDYSPSPICWSSDYSNSEDEDPFHPDPNLIPSKPKYVALADYNAIGNNELTIKEGDFFELLKVGCAGWWFVRFYNSSKEGWAPAAYLQLTTNQKSKYQSQDGFSD